MAVSSMNVKLNVHVYECVLFFPLSKRIACVPVFFPLSKRIACVPVIFRELRMFVLTFHSRYYKCDTVFMCQIMCILCSIT